MKTIHYNNFRELQYEVYKAITIKGFCFFPEDLVDAIAASVYALNDKEKALALGILREKQSPINGYRLFNAAKSLGMNWSASKNNIIRALKVYSWAYGDSLLDDNGNPIGSKDDVYLHINLDRVDQYSPLN